MKKLFLWMAFLGLSQLILAQNVQISQNSYQKVAVSFTTGDLEVEDVDVPQGVFSMISLPGYTSSYNPGMPQLPQLTKLLQIPVCDSVIATVTNAQYMEYDAATLGIHHPLFPSQESVAKKDTSYLFSYNSTVYATDAFFHQPLIQVEKAGVKRNVVLANIYFSPVQYNPYQQKIRIYTHVDVEFTFANADMGRTYALQQYASPLFAMDKDLVLNKMQEDRSEFSASPIRYLIIGNPMFESNEKLAEFVAWKRRIGYIVDVVFTNDANVGTTTTSIKNYIQSQYNAATAENPAPTFLLFLGDREQLPAFNAQTSNNNHITDLYYATLSGNDYLPDCYYGRLSATNNQQLSNQLEKILMYEQYTMPDPSYLGRAVLIAGNDQNYGPVHANGQINYIKNNYINTTNPAYTDVMAHMHNCSSQAALIRSEVSEGAGWVNYTAHGSETSWADPEFNTTQVYALQNENKYGLMIGNCCQSGNFKTGECFGEALLRAEKKGAMGYIGASNNSYWGEDFYWAVGFRNNITANPTYNSMYLGAYDKIFHTHNEDYDVWVSTIAGMMTTGNLTVQSTSSSLKQYYWEIYHCFGDPSVRPYLGIPNTMTVEATPVITTNTLSYSVNVAPYAYVALTQNGNVMMAAFADENGDVTFNFPSALDAGEYELVAMAQNYIPFLQTLLVIIPDGPYVVTTSIEVAENAVFTQGSTVNMNLSLSNVGVSGASQVYAKLIPETNLTMLQDSVFVGTIAVEETEVRSNAFSFQMPASEDYVNLPFTLYIHWNDTTITRSVNVRVILPKVTLNSYKTMVNNEEVVNYQPGMEVDYVFTNINRGHASVNTGTVDLTCNYSGVKVLTNSSNINGLEPNATLDKTFKVQIADTVPEKSIVKLYYHTNYDNMQRVDTLTMLVGGDFETFETGDFSQFAWNMNNYPWLITNAMSYTGQYSARSAMNLPGNGNSRMSITTTSNTDSEISYYRKVSTEDGYDFFYLYVDGAKKDEASGSLNWTFVSVPVSAGTHTFRFAYEKDYSQSGGSDCVWIDNVSLPCNGIVVIEDIQDDVSVEDYEKVPSAFVYPNPTSEWVMVDSEQPVTRIDLYDQNGRLVRTENMNAANHCQLQMSDMSTGFYLMRVTFDNNQTKTLKIIKK